MAGPLCRYCGKPIPKRTISIRFVEERKSFMQDDMFTRFVIGTPMTKDEAQRLLNMEIISVKRGSNPWAHNPDDVYIYAAGTWDGESYKDQFFCSGACAQGFAYMVARSPAYAGLGSEDYAAALKRQQEKGRARQ